MKADFISDLNELIHRKVCKDRKVQPHYGTRMTRIARIFTDPCASASSAQSMFHHVCSSLKNPASGTKVSAFIRVHQRFFYGLMKEVRHIPFKDIVVLQRGFDLPKKDMNDGSYPVIGSTSIIGHHSEYRVEPPGVVTGRSGSLGVVQYIRDKYWPHNTALWVKDFKGNFPRYVYYYLKTVNLERFNSGAGVPTLNRNDLDTLEIAIHPLPAQRKIAAILSTYDDLIENNIRRIKILEEMAQALYREWFVNFRFPGHEKVKIVESELGMVPEGNVIKLVIFLLFL